MPPPPRPLPRYRAALLDQEEANARYDNAIRLEREKRERLQKWNALTPKQKEAERQLQAQAEAARIAAAKAEAARLAAAKAEAEAEEKAQAEAARIKAEQLRESSLQFADSLDTFFERTYKIFTTRTNTSDIPNSITPIPKESYEVVRYQTLLFIENNKGIGIDFGIMKSPTKILRLIEEELKPDLNDLHKKLSEQYSEELLREIIEKFRSILTRISIIKSKYNMSFRNVLIVKILPLLEALTEFKTSTRSLNKAPTEDDISEAIKDELLDDELDNKALKQSEFNIKQSTSDIFTDLFGMLNRKYLDAIINKHKEENTRLRKISYGKENLFSRSFIDDAKVDVQISEYLREKFYFRLANKNELIAIWALFNKKYSDIIQKNNIKNKEELNILLTKYAGSPDSPEYKTIKECIDYKILDCLFRPLIFDPNKGWIQQSQPGIISKLKYLTRLPFGASASALAAPARTTPVAAQVAASAAIERARVASASTSDIELRPSVQQAITAEVETLKFTSTMKQKE